jgi:hypothetical protein
MNPKSLEYYYYSNKRKWIWGRRDGWKESKIMIAPSTITLARRMWWQMHWAESPYRGSVILDNHTTGDLLPVTLMKIDAVELHVTIGSQLD